MSISLYFRFTTLAQDNLAQDNLAQDNFVQDSVAHNPHLLPRFARLHATVSVIRYSHVPWLDLHYDRTNNVVKVEKEEAVAPIAAGGGANATANSDDAENEPLKKKRKERDQKTS